MASTLNVLWPSNVINLNELEKIFSQNPAFSQFNIQFPDKTNWGVSPSNVQSLVSSLQDEAQSIGVKGSLPDLSFTSLAAGVLTSGSPLKSGMSKFLINPHGDIKSQMDNALRELRYDSLDLSNSLPDWLKRIFLAIYDAVFSTFELLGSKLGGLLGR